MDCSIMKPCKKSCRKKGGVSDMVRPCKICDEVTFRTLHKLCARLTR